jgi:preprotein translocase subunit SecG
MGNSLNLATDISNISANLKNIVTRLPPTSKSTSESSTSVLGVQVGPTVRHTHYDTSHFGSILFIIIAILFVVGTIILVIIGKREEKKRLQQQQQQQQQVPIEKK